MVSDCELYSYSALLGPLHKSHLTWSKVYCNTTTAPGPPAQLGLDVPYRSPAIFVPTASNLGVAIICPNSSTASLGQPQRPPASSTQLLYRRRSPPYLPQRHTPLLLRPAPASLAPLPLRCRSRDRLPSSGMACGPASARTACSVGPRCAVPIACNIRPDGQQPRRCNHLPQ